jgi:hypothetical protein
VAGRFDVRINVAVTADRTGVGCATLFGASGFGYIRFVIMAECRNYVLFYEDFAAVSAMASFSPIAEKITARRVGDRAAIITTLNDDESVFRVTGCAAFGAHHNAYRICGENGQIENLRGMGEKVMLRYSEWAIPEGKEEVNLYDPVWNDSDEEFIKNAGHGGGDYIVSRMFLDCIKEKSQPEHPYDIYSAVNMACVAILAHRSILNGGIPYDIPDFHLEECRKEYENDRHSPFQYTDGTEPNIPCCSHPDFSPTQEQIEKMKELLKD